jgi:hypothetical protein
MAGGRGRAGPIVALAGLFAVTGYAFWQGMPAAPPPVAPPAQQAMTPAEPRADGPPLPLVLRMPDFAATEVRPNGVVTAMGQGDPGTRMALIQNGVAVVDQPTAADGRFSVISPQLNRPGTFEYRLRAGAPDGRTVMSEELLTVVVPRTTAEAFTAVISGPGGNRELARIDPTPLVVPRFQQVQVQPNGVASIGGQVDPGARVLLLANGREIGGATANPQGNFAIGPTQPLAAGVTRLELRSTHSDGRIAMSAERMIVDIPTVPGGAFSATLEAPQQVPRVLAQTPAANPRLPRFDAVEARPDGTFTATGTVEPNARVSLLLNGQPSGQPVMSATNGQWSLSPVEPAQPGTTEYRLRSVLGDGRTATSEERLIIQRPRTAAEAFEARVEQQGQPARVAARIEAQPIPAPRFGQVVVGEGGALTLSGTAAPGARVELRAGSEVLSSVLAGGDGGFNLRFQVPPAIARTIFGLFSSVADGRSSTAPDQMFAERSQGGALRMGLIDAAGTQGAVFLDQPAVATIRDLIAALPPPPPIPVLVLPAAPVPQPVTPPTTAVQTVQPRMAAPAPPAQPRASVPNAPRRPMLERDIK